MRINATEVCLEGFKPPGGQRQTEKEPVIPTPLVSLVAREGLEPPAQGFSVPCSTD